VSGRSRRRAVDCSGYDSCVRIRLGGFGSIPRAISKGEGAKKTTQLAEWERTYSQLEEINRYTADLKKRSRQVTHLMGQQRRSIQLLDTVSRSLDPLKLWLIRLEMQQDQVTLMGFADSKAQIVQFVQYLKRDGLFQEVTVLEAGQVSGKPSKYNFTMTLLLRAELNHVTSS